MLTRSRVPPGSPSLRFRFESESDEDDEPIEASPPGSPSLAWRPGTSFDSPDSPSRHWVPIVDLAGQGAPLLHRDEGGSSESAMISMTRATCQRASRAARASDPDVESRNKAHAIVLERLKKFREYGYERAARDTQAYRSHRVGLGSGGKGPGVRTNLQDQGKMNHIASLKAKDVDASNTEPAFLLGGYTTPMMWDRLAESSLKSNAVNSSVSSPPATIPNIITPFTILFLVCRY